MKEFMLLVQLSTDKTVKVLNILEKSIQDGSKLSTLLNHVSLRSILFSPLLLFIYIYFFFNLFLDRGEGKE